MRKSIVGLFVLLLSAGLFAQESTVKGNLGGVVTDRTGAVVAKSKITLTGPTGNRTTTTDSQGRFMFDLLVPGFYSVKAEQPGFKVVEMKQVEVFANRTATVPITLEPGAITETVEVSATAAGVDVAATKLETNLNDTFYSQIPVSRNVTGLFYAAAGVNEGGGTGSANPSIAGGSGLENQYIADGVNITDGAFGGIGVFSRNYGALATGINLSFVKEVDVKTGGYEPQYGKSTGGVVQIVTKSGSDHFHGGISGFFGPQQFEVQHLNPDNAGRLNQQGVAYHQGEWDIAGELGGYVPGLRNNLFFFGSFNPSWNRIYDRFAPLHGVSGFPAQPNSVIPQISYDYAAKLTFKLTDKHVIETSVFGDPTRETSGAPNGGPTGLSLTSPNKTPFSKISNGTRNFVLRYNGTLSPTWLVSASMSWGHNYLNETPSALNVFQVTDDTGAGNGTTALGTLGTPLTGIYNRQGLGYYENTQGDNWGLSFDTQKVVNKFGQHSIGIGYHYERNRYYGNRQASGGGYPVPDAIADVTTCKTCPTGFLPHGLTDYADSFQLDPAANWGLTGGVGVFDNVPGNGPTEVVLIQNRGFFSTPAFDSHGRYHSAYAGDSWAIGRHITINAGYRWEQQQIQGLKYTDPIFGITKQVHYTFTDNWSPRFGLAIDPFGDRKTKIYGNFALTSYALPLDAAIRSLGNEEDAFFLFLQPPFTNPNPGAPCSATNQCQLAVNSDGSITPAIDGPHALSGYLALSTQPGEGIAPGTKMMYLQEYVGGVEHEFHHGVVASVRYQQRRLQRIIEDMSGVSPEANLLGITQQFQIGNPSPSLDIFTNTNEQIFPAGTATATNCPSGVFGTNTNPFNGSQADVCILNPDTAGSLGPDGKPDGAAKPVRTYKAVEVEISKTFSKGWQLRTNYRWSTLAGNYEGAFRNDNGQSDPGISSLFDFTTGSLGLLGNQFAIGFLNTDRRHILNNFISYAFSSGFLKNLTLGTSIRIETGVPINDLRAHPIYQNAGEIPFGGRGALGRTPTTGEGDLHAEYTWKMGESQALHFGSDLFNIANQKTQLRIDQFQDASLNNPNFDFKRPVGTGSLGVSPAYQRPFNARLFVKWIF
jgi:Carboxypeptidase regulatory-like domain/TonB-dependent Receptor Plug Domain